MISVKRIGAMVLTASFIAGMLQTAVFAVDVVPEDTAQADGMVQTQEAVQIITGFERAGQQIGTISFVLGQPQEELTARMPQTVTASLADGTAAQIPVTWVSVGDYANTDDFYYEFIPQWDAHTYVLADGVDGSVEVPYIVAERGTRQETGDASVQSKQSASSANADTIFNFLLNKMHYNAAAACGILANIEAESDFNPNCYGDGGTSYGICQWHNERFTALKNWCGANGYNWKTLDGQLHYLEKEMSANNASFLWNGLTINNKMKTFANTNNGSYDAGHYWCYYYEVPANRESVAKSRGNRAKTTYWPKYSKKVVSDQSSVSAIFSDVSSTAWYKDSVQYVYDKGLMVGTSSNKFSPNGTLSRAMVAQILYSEAGKPSVSTGVPFKDISKSAWYYKAVCWAYRKGYMEGYSSQKFGPEDSVTHEQAAVILHVHAGKPTSSKSLSFKDAENVSSWAVKAVKWANYRGMLGYVALEKTNYYYPQRVSTRAEMAYVLSAYLG